MIIVRCLVFSNLLLNRGDSANSYRHRRNGAQRLGLKGEKKQH